MSQTEREQSREPAQGSSHRSWWGRAYFTVQRANHVNTATHYTFQPFQTRSEVWGGDVCTGTKV